MPPAPKTRFELPDIKKVVADVTKRFYTTNLNKISSGGYSTVKDLLDNQEDVLKIVKEQPADRQKGMMNAIFYALSDHPNTHKVSYYNYFQVLKSKDPKYVEHMKKEEEKKAVPAKPVKAKATKAKAKPEVLENKIVSTAQEVKPEVKPKRKYTKKIKDTIEEVVNEIQDHIKTKKDKCVKDEEKKISELKAALKKHLKMLKDELLK